MSLDGVPVVIVRRSRYWVCVRHLDGRTEWVSTQYAGLVLA